MLFSDYEKQIQLTDQFSSGDLHPILYGLFGEVGSVMATIKKQYREKKVYSGYRTAVIEELGDTLWYFATLCRKLGFDLENIFDDLVNEEHYRHTIAASDVLGYPLSRVSGSKDQVPLDGVLVKLGATASELLSVSNSDGNTEQLLRSFADVYVQTVQKSSVSFFEIVHSNIKKTHGRFLDCDLKDLPNFDAEFPEEEQLPDEFRIEITQRKIGKSYMRWNGVFIGDPLTDNIGEEDHYRFHDVFHMAHAAILHWSPVFRALIKHKRKSNQEVDRNQDGGRAIAVEEGLTTWIFSCAKEVNYFQDQCLLPFDLLKVVQKIVRGYEVEACPLSLWEKAILDGYKVFRQVRDNEGGIVVGNRQTRTIDYYPKK